MTTAKLHSAEELAVVRATFALDGDELLRKGKPVKHRANANKSPYKSVEFRLGNARVHWKLSRLKFFLAHGWLPPVVDHRNGDRLNDSLANLRAASYAQNNQNSRRRKTRLGLPRGVERNGKRFVARLKTDGRMKYLGTYDTPEAASLAVQEKSKELRGAFHRYRRKG
ncbi:MAG: hypothetical protein GEV13_03155 [Rhodospirillales bacterium]|nr:hypothetical protein [Rhodospirillales bacterium]